jgi:hypothetical protein
MNYYLAQLNIAKMKAPIDSPVMHDFVNNLDLINSIAEESDGFIWRLKGETDNATALRVFEDQFLIINMSVWKSKDALFQFTYHSDHRRVFKRKGEWFNKMDTMHMVLWYVPEDTMPGPEDAKKRLHYLNLHGETPYAFSFKSAFTIEDALNYTPKIPSSK